MLSTIPDAIADDPEDPEQLGAAVAAGDVGDAVGDLVDRARSPRARRP